MSCLFVVHIVVAFGKKQHHDREIEQRQNQQNNRKNGRWSRGRGDHSPAHTVVVFWMAPPQWPLPVPASQNFWGWPCKYRNAVTLHINKHNFLLYIIYIGKTLLGKHPHHTSYHHHNFLSLTYCGNVHLFCVFNGGCVYAYIMDIIRKKKVLCSHLVNLFMVMYYIHKPLNSHETTRRSGLSRFLSKKKKGKRLLFFKILHRICPGCFPERTGARCHLKKGQLAPAMMSEVTAAVGCCCTFGAH